MKRLNLIIICLVFSLVYCPKFYSQYNCQTNIYDNGLNLETPKTNSKNSFNIAGINCNTNGFFGVRSNGTIDEFSLNGSALTFTNSILTGSNITSIAYCNNLNGFFSKTFYASSNNSGTYTPSYFDGSAWINTPNTFTNALYNCGCSNNDIYYSSNYNSSVYARRIIKYDGNSFVEIYGRANRVLAIADLAVDGGGNIWFLTGTDSLNFVSDSIMEISPTGEILKQLPFSYNCYNAYGSFILNDVYYVAFGSSNSLSPNKLLPMTFISNIVTTGNFINMPANNYTDLASCNAGYPIGVKKNNTNITDKIKFYPTPTSDKIKVEFENEDLKESKLDIINSLGQIVYTLNNPDQKQEIDLSFLASGVYYLVVQNRTEQKAVKLIKE
ncbi:MAG: T9SS type A sorting domain-containing protein [Bacteroidetes bacterium]|nr:T9SS type A sorting domain-containing protein [Bacteroidota bacterium]